MRDAGWLFLIAGLGLIAGVVLVSGADDLASARAERDTALAHEARSQERVERYRAFLTGLETGEPSLRRELERIHLNDLGDGRRPLVEVSRRNPDEPADVFGALEPGPAEEVEPRRTSSALARIASSDAVRPWVLAGGVLCVFVGLLPGARRVEPDEMEHARGSVDDDDDEGWEEDEDGTDEDDPEDEEGDEWEDEPDEEPDDEEEEDDDEL